MARWIKKGLLFLFLLLVLIQLIDPRGDCPDGFSAQACREIQHQVYLDNKRDLNDKIYGTPEMRREDAERQAAEDAYTHEK